MFMFKSGSKHIHIETTLLEEDDYVKYFTMWKS